MGEESLLDRLKKLAPATILKNCPSPPAETKWTKLGPAIRSDLLLLRKQLLLLMLPLLLLLLLLQLTGR